MQPNQNMPGMGQPANPVRPVSSAGAAGVAGPAKPVTPANNSAFNNGPSVVEGKGGKKTGWILGLVFLLILAAGGIGFGVWAWMGGNAQKDALNSQIGALVQRNGELLEQIENLSNQMTIEVEDDDTGIVVEELNGDMALDLLRKAVSSGEYEAPYGIGYANIYAKYNGSDKVAYWVKYWPTHIQNNEVAVAYDIIFTKNDDGGWDFELPGFTDYTTDLVEKYTILRVE